MITITINNWLPIAENMQIDILYNLKQIHSERVYNIGSKGDLIFYDASAPLYNSSIEVANFQVKGYVDSRGFTRHQFLFQPLEGYGIDTSIDLALESATRWLTNLLFDTIPIAVKNKLAVLHENIVSHAKFTSTLFSPSISSSAKSYLDRTYSVFIILGKEYHNAYLTGLSIKYANLYVPSAGNHGIEMPNAHVSSTANHHSIILLHAESFNVDDIDPVSGTLYKVCAHKCLEIYMQRTIQILKETRDHVMPLRRNLAIMLQRNTEEHFAKLNNMKKYLTYVNIKLPVIYKVVAHLQTVLSEENYKRIAINYKPSEYPPTLLSLNNTIIDINETKTYLNENRGRVASLYDEDFRELSVLSSELSAVMEANLLSENVKLSFREVEISESILNLDRGAKHRSNALKILNFILSINTAVVVADFFKLQGFRKALLAIVITSIAWFVLEIYIKRRSSYFQLHIPINDTVPSDSLETLTNNKLISDDGNSSRRVRTWNEALYTFHHREEILGDSPNSLFGNGRSGKKRVFEFTIDYEKRGYVHSIAIRTEHNNDKFSTRDLVIQIFRILHKAGCLNNDERKYRSLLAEVLTNLGVSLHTKLKSINRVLTMHPKELEHLLDDTYLSMVPKDVSPDDLEFINDIRVKHVSYISWLGRLLDMNDNLKIVPLLGEDNLKSKLDVISKLKRNDNQENLSNELE